MQPRFIPHQKYNGAIFVQSKGEHVQPVILVYSFSPNDSCGYGRAERILFVDAPDETLFFINIEQIVLYYRGEGYRAEFLSLTEMEVLGLFYNYTRGQFGTPYVKTLTIGQYFECPCPLRRQNSLW